MNRTIDTLGHPVSGSTAPAIDQYERAAHELRCLINDPLASVDRALAEAPAMSIAHTLRAWLHLLGTEAPALATAREAAEAAARHAGTDRERLHARAAALVADGRWRDGGRVLEDLSAPAPSATCSRCRPGTRSNSSPATRACCATASRARAAALERRHAGPPRRARHARLRARGNRRPCRGPSAPDGAPSTCSRATPGPGMR